MKLSGFDCAEWIPCGHCGEPAWNGARGGIYPACIRCVEEQWRCLLELVQLAQRWADESLEGRQAPDYAGWEDASLEAWDERASAFARRALYFERFGIGDSR